jgi:hypothetical protein
LIALLSVLASVGARPGPRIAAQDAPAEPAVTPVEAAAVEPTATAAPTTAPAATAEPTATPEPTEVPTATAEPTATAAPIRVAEPTADPPTETPLEPPAEPTASSEPSPTPAPSPTPEPPATETTLAEAAADTVATTAVEAPIAPPVAAAEQPLLTLAVAGEAVSFGRVSATGALDPAIPGLTRTTDASGASYVLADAVAVTVTAGAAWSGGCRAIENAGSAAAVTIAGGRLEWRLVGTTAWAPFATASSDHTCFPRPGAGTRTYVYDLRLRVEATDPPGTFQTVLVFEATP